MMFNNLVLGVYFPGKSFLHRLQARTKLLLLLGFVVWLVIANQRVWHFFPYILAFVLLCLGIALAHISPREIWRRIWLLLFFLLLGAIPTLTAKGADARTLYMLGPLMLSYGFVREFLLICGSVCALLYLVSRLPFASAREFWSRRRMRPLRTLLGLLALLSFFFLWLLHSPPANQRLPIGPYVVTYGGVWIIVTAFVVLIVLYVSSLLVTMTTSPIMLIEGLTLLLAPLRRLKLPVDDFALMTLLALRFVPTLLEEVEQLIKAQTARGADLTTGTLRERFQSLTMLVVPLMQGSLRRASELATALDARGYEVTGRQTLMHETTLKMADYATLIVFVLLATGSLFL